VQMPEKGGGGGVAVVEESGRWGVTFVQEILLTSDRAGSPPRFSQWSVAVGSTGDTPGHAGDSSNTRTVVRV